ncbi:MMPL family transporter [Gordonia neofelifaecis]|uniref:Putative drug exporter of the RND superfamily n=1 Tax=Gordonia neofelifaecis NRRL B-59395 TaxID=644548 RepID=F1YKE6_9ACTN|nr:MMPL family transporter [Gordonia neofelifaecis]EGD54832.1 putative drug exporter of the RND superfamily [Gordonia neofelifaecis NRRL B-59395]
MAPRRIVRVVLPAAIVLIWLVIGGLTGPLSGKLSTVTTDDASAFLPQSAESTRVAEELPAFTDTGYFPAIVVAEKSTPMTDADRDFVVGAVAPLAGTEGFGGQFSPALPSADGEAVQLFVPVSTEAKPKDQIAELTDALANPPPGVSVAITGPAAQAADLSNAFAGIDGILLLVAGAVVLLILIVVYRSPILPFVVLLSAIFALALASGVVYGLAKAGVLELNGQSQGILFILVFGAATDYALLLVARYREALADEPDARDALRTAWRATIPPITASAATVILGVLCLLLSDLNSNRSLGPIAALGIAASFLASITFLPAMLALIGRSAFWPRVPDTEGGSAHRIWQRVAAFVARSPRRVWAGTLVVLVIGAAFAPAFRSDGVSTDDFFLGEAASVTGSEMHARHFDAGSGTPTWVTVNQDSATTVADQIRAVDGVAAAEVLADDRGPVTHDGRRAVQVTLSDDPDSLAAQDTIVDIRSTAHAVPGADALVGGGTAVDLDTRISARHDRNLIIPVVLLVVLAVLIVLLRSLLAPLMLLATTVLSFGTALGVAALLFNGPFGFPGADPVVPLFAFVFLVALGIDYNIFLMTRAREEAQRHGTRDGMLRALTSTGGVISAAGLVLAATFSALAVIPLLFLAQVAFLVAFGVLVDTLVVRSLLVPALTLDVGPRIWWPGRPDASSPGGPSADQPAR